MVAPFSDLQKHCECKTCRIGGGAVALLVLCELLTGEAPETVQAPRSGQVIRAAAPVFPFEVFKTILVPPCSSELHTMCRHCFYATERARARGEGSGEPDDETSWASNQICRHVLLSDPAPALPQMHRVCDIVSLWYMQLSWAPTSS